MLRGAMTAIPLDELRRYVSLCDPNRPLSPGDPLYVEFDKGIPTRGSQSESCIAQLYRTIALASSDYTRQLFSGFPGTGKTTELQRLKAELNDAQDLSTRAVYIDFEEYLDRYTPVSIIDVLRVLAHCLDREALVAEGKNPDREPGYLRRLFDFLSQTDAELSKIGFQAYGASLMLELKNNPQFRVKAEETIKQRFQQFADEARLVMTEAVARIAKAPGVAAARIVVIADGLEKFAPLREEDRASVEASVEALFLTHARLLRIPCHVIYTFPIWLRFRATDLGASYDREPVILPMVKIADRSREPYAAGVDKVRDLVARRIDLKRVFGEGYDERLLPLIFASGGYPRDLLRMLRELLYAAKRFPVDGATVEWVINQFGQNYARVVRTPDLPILAHVAETNRLPEGDQAEVAQFGRLLDRWLVLAYRNGDEWYDLHPLVRRAPVVEAFLAHRDVEAGHP